MKLCATAVTKLKMTSQHCCGSKARIRVICKFQRWYKLNSGAMVEESCYTMRGSSPQIKREGDNTIVIFEVAGVRSVQEWL